MLSVFSKYGGAIIALQCSSDPKKTQDNFEQTRRLKITQSHKLSAFCFAENKFVTQFIWRKKVLRLPFIPNKGFKNNEEAVSVMLHNYHCWILPKLSFSLIKKKLPIAPVPLDEFCKKK